MYNYKYSKYKNKYFNLKKKIIIGGEGDDEEKKVTLQNGLNGDLLKFKTINEAKQYCIDNFPNTFYNLIIGYNIISNNIEENSEDGKIPLDYIDINLVIYNKIKLSNIFNNKEYDEDLFKSSIRDRYNKPYKNYKDYFDEMTETNRGIFNSSSGVILTRYIFTIFTSHIYIDDMLYECLDSSNKIIIHFQLVRERNNNFILTVFLRQLKTGHTTFSVDILNDIYNVNDIKKKILEFFNKVYYYPDQETSGPPIMITL